MQFNLITLPQEIHFNIFSYLKGSELIQITPFVCKLFNELSRDEVLWNQQRQVSRQIFQRKLAFTVKYVNQIALRYLIPINSLDYQSISKAAPFAQKQLISDFISRAIDQWNQPQTKSSTAIASNVIFHPLKNVWSWWNQIKPTNFCISEQEAMDMKNAICQSSIVLQFRSPKFNEMPLQINLLNQLHIKHSSYISSALHALLYIDSVRQQFQCLIDLPERPVAQSNDYQIQLGKYEEKLEIAAKKIAIQQEILQFIYASEYNNSIKSSNDLNNEELNSFLLINPSFFYLKNAIFGTALPYEFIHNISEECDPILMIEVLLENFLFDYHLEYQIHTATAELPGYEFVSCKEKRGILTFPLRRNPPYQLLERMICNTFGKHIEKYPCTFYPENGFIVDQNKANFYQSNAAKEVGEYTAWYRLKNLPSGLILRLNREMRVNGWDNSAVFLPKEGLIDLSSYYDFVEGEHRQQAIYRIKSYIVYDEISLFVSHIERNGKYFACSEHFPEGYQEITKDEFLSNTNAYLVVLERVTDA